MADAQARTGVPGTSARSLRRRPAQRPTAAAGRARRAGRSRPGWCRRPSRCPCRPSGPPWPDAVRPGPSCVPRARRTGDARGCARCRPARRAAPPRRRFARRPPRPAAGGARGARAGLDEQRRQVAIVERGDARGVAQVRERLGVGSRCHPGRRGRGSVAENAVAGGAGGVSGAGAGRGRLRGRELGLGGRARRGGVGRAAGSAGRQDREQCREQRESGDARDQTVCADQMPVPKTRMTQRLIQVVPRMIAARATLRSGH